MRLGHRPAALWSLSLLLLSFLTSTVVAKDKPELKATKLDHAPLNIRYFEDSDVILYQDIKDGSIRRSDDAGASWKVVDSIPKGQALALIMHPFEKKSAFVVSDGVTHYKTRNQGETWDKFEPGLIPSSYSPEVLTFHADDPGRIIFNGMDCQAIFCDEMSMYTTDNFESSKVLRGFTSGCHWANSSPEFTTGESSKDKDRVLCMVKDPFSIFREDQRLLVSDSFFALENDEIQEFEPNIDGNKGMTGVVNLATVKKFILVATTVARSDEMALFVTTDTVKWHRAIFPSGDSHDHSHRISQDSYTVLESTNYSIQVDVMTSHPARPMGVLFTSNSNGTFFTENIPYTNRNTKKHVDFEQITGIQGIYVVNVVANGKDVDDSASDKELVSQITFDDGRTFSFLTAGDDKLHLHAITELDNTGRVFSSPAPGLVLGNGNTGDTLGSFNDADLFVSDDAGVHWKKALDGPHKYEFGDSGSVLVAIEDSAHEDINKISYSLDHGDKWKTVKLPDKLKIQPVILTTTQDSTSLKFLLIGQVKDTYYSIAIDFDGLHERTCESGDMEDWHARVDDEGEPTCIMGHKQTYLRRKKSAECFIKDEFKDPVPTTEDCECTDADFECDYNFQRDPDDRSVCKKAGPIPIPDGACKKGDDTFKGSSGWRLIPGNTCKRSKGDQKDDEVERDCSEGLKDGPSQPADGKIKSTQKVFSDAKVKDFQKIYLDRGDASFGTDETVIMRPAEDEGNDRLRVDNQIWLSKNHGKEWEQILKGEKVEGIYPHGYFNDIVYFTTHDSNKVIYTVDRGGSFHSFKAPTKPGNTLPVSFHPNNKDWLIWVGKTCDDVGDKGDCYYSASISTDRGDNWKTVQRYVNRCEFTGHSAYNFRPLKQIVCLVHKEENEKAPLTVLTSNDFFDEDKDMLDMEVSNFATMSEFIMLARVDEKADSTRALASLDGKNFETAHFPHNFPHGPGSQYTILDSSTHAVNMFVQSSGSAGRQHGDIVKSNSNGTSYVLSARNVNCDENMFVDYEKVVGLEGVSLINVVANPGKGPKTKNLQTKISHNDGSEWAYLPPPGKDVEGKKYSCRSDSGDNKCALHLHHYTERDDRRKTFAASTAVGLLFGVGNVGSKLEDIKKADTFMTSDGGITWKNVKKGHWTWQYGDQGSIIVLVQRATRKNDVKTKMVSYSTDEGETWKDYTFAESEVTVLDITTVKAGTSRNFLLWCKSQKDELFTVNLDFTGLTDKACEKTDGSDSDYRLWSPKHPLQDDDCLFGHVAKYLRKKPGRECYNDMDLSRMETYETCACSRRDYECAYNFELDDHGQCSLVEGYSPLSGSEWCEQHPNATSWFEPTGYRKVSLSTCQGGKEMDKMSTEHPCDGYEDEFERKHRTSGVAIFFAVVVPICIAGGVGWYVYRNWDGKFGQIRLGDGGARASSTFDSEQPWVKYPVIAVSAAVAIVSSLPLLAASLWRTATTSYSRVGGGGGGRSWLSGPRRFTTRDSFARGRGDYSVVDDEGELLGDESDEEV